MGVDTQRGRGYVVEWYGYVSTEDIVEIAEHISAFSLIGKGINRQTGGRETTHVKGRHQQPLTGLCGRPILSKEHGALRPVKVPVNHS